MASSKEVKAAAFPANINRPNWRFSPDEGALIVNYLLKKVNNEPILENIIDVNLKLEDPEALIKAHPKLGDKEWYFFTPRERKYPNGGRPDRGCKTGYWKATGCDNKIYFEDRLVGFWRKLVFYRAGEAQKGEKTNLVMTEYRLDRPPKIKETADDMRLDDWVLCKIYEKAEKASKPSNKKRKRDNVGVLPTYVAATVGTPQNVGGEPWLLTDDRDRYLHSIPVLMNDRHLQPLGYGGQHQNPLKPNFQGQHQQYPHDRYLQSSFLRNGGYGGQHQDPRDHLHSLGHRGHHKGPGDRYFETSFVGNGDYGGLHQDPHRRYFQSSIVGNRAYGQPLYQDCLNGDPQDFVRHVHSSFPAYGGQLGGHIGQPLHPLHQDGVQNSVNCHVESPVPVPGYGEQQHHRNLQSSQHLPQQQHHRNLRPLQHLPVPTFPGYGDEQHHQDSIFFQSLTEESPARVNRSLEQVADDFTTNNPIDDSATNNIPTSPNDSDITFNPYTPKDRSY